MTTTRISNAEKHNAAMAASAAYRNSAIRIYEAEANYPMEGFTRHAPFEDRYLENTVWEAIAHVVGPVRADHVANSAFRQILALARNQHLTAVQDGYCDENGLPTRIIWAITYTKAAGQGQHRMIRKDWRDAQQAAITLREAGFREVRVRAAQDVPPPKR